MDLNELEIKELKMLLKESGELIWNVDHYWLPSNDAISDQSQNLLTKIEEALK
ncbi:unnamed protein product [marine sediment metagenome]|uniref:Uncharacterized protein n=1 Tax=marine sediment metagenome TaxID=412755 RepID=X1B0A8_9ZZZZ